MTNQPTEAEADEQVSRDFVKALFARDETDEPREQQKPSGHIPGEGTNPTEPGHDMRAWVAALFDTTD